MDSDVCNTFKHFPTASLFECGVPPKQERCVCVCERACVFLHLSITRHQAFGSPEAAPCSESYQNTTGLMFAKPGLGRSQVICLDI